MSPADQRLRILHLILVLRSTNSQYNEHSLPVMTERDISLCTYFEPQLQAPDEIEVFAGDNTLIGFFRALRTALRARDHDVVHAHSPQTGVFFIIATLLRLDRGLRRRSVYTVHDSFYDYKRRNQLMMIPALAFFSRVVFCSDAAYASLPKVLHRLVGKRARVVQNGVDIERVDRVLASFERERSDRFRIISVGRLEEVKDPLALTRAFALAGDTESELVFVGDGDLRPEVERAVSESPLGDRIRLLGLVEREEVFRQIANAHVFVSVSHGEGLPVAAMEAMACSVPVVLSDIAPHREFAAPAEVVPLVPPGDVDGFAQAIARLRAMSDDERAAIGRASRDLVASRFTLDRMNQGYESIYDEIRAGSDRR